MPVLFNFVRKKKRERERGRRREENRRERKREREGEREKFQVCDYTTKSVAWKEGKTRYLASWIFGKPCSSNFILFNFEERGESAREAKRDKAMVIFITPVFLFQKC